MTSDGPLSSAWRIRCPEGHASLNVSGDGYRCSACRSLVPYVVDLREDRRIYGRVTV